MRRRKGNSRSLPTKMRIIRRGERRAEKKRRGTRDENKYTTRRPQNNKANYGIYGKNGPFQARSKMIQGRYLKEKTAEGKNVTL